MNKLINKQSFTFTDYFFTESLLIRAIRKIYNLSQKDFCLLFNCTQSALSKIENGLISPDLKLIINLAQHLNLDLNIFKYGQIPQVPKNLLNNIQNNIIGTEYTENGLFNSKTVFTTMEIIKKHFHKNVYQKLNIKPELFCFSFLKFNMHFLKKIFADISISEFNKISNMYKLNDFRVTSSNGIYSHIINNKLLDLLKINKDLYSESYNLKINHSYFPNISEHEESLYINIFYLDLKLLFGNCVQEVIYKKHGYIIEVNFAA